MATVQDTINTLMEMGFSENKSKKALMETGWKGVEPAMEWLLAHVDDPEPEESELKESETPPKTLTEEEKKEKLRKLEELRVIKRKEREEKEKAEEIEREKKRIQEGKVLTTLKKTMEEKEMDKIVAERRREKIETQKAKERVKAQIEADKQARREAEQRRNGILPTPAPPPPTPTPSTSSSSSSVVKKDYTETKIQIRLPNGSSLVQTFSVKEPLSAVRVYVQMNRNDTVSSEEPVKFMTNFPKKIFGIEDYEKPLDSLGLVPSAVIIVTK